MALGAPDRGKAKRNGSRLPSQPPCWSLDDGSDPAPQKRPRIPGAKSLLRVAAPGSAPLESAPGKTGRGPKNRTWDFFVRHPETAPGSRRAKPWHAPGKLGVRLRFCVGLRCRPKQHSAEAVTAVVPLVSLRICSTLIFLGRKSHQQSEQIAPKPVVLHPKSSTLCSTPAAGF